MSKKYFYKKEYIFVYYNKIIVYSCEKCMFVIDYLYNFKRHCNTENIFERNIIITGFMICNRIPYMVLYGVNYTLLLINIFIYMIYGMYYVN